MHSFRNRILILIIGLVVGTQIVTLVAVSARIGDDVRAQADDQLEAAGAVVGQLMAVRSAQLANAVSVLAADFGFREAVTSGDRATIVSAMDNQLGRIHADLALVLDPDGAALATTGIRGRVDERAVARMMELRSASRERPSFVILGGRPYQFVVVPVRAPQLVAWVAMGFAVDDSVATEVRRLVGLEVAFITVAGNTRHVVATTLPAFSGSQRVVDSPHAPHAPRTARTLSAGTTSLLIGGEEWLSVSRQLDPQDPMLQFMLLNPTRVVMKPFDEAQEAMLLIGGTALLFALVAGVLMGRSATQPVIELDAAARRIEGGDYGEAVTVRGAREFERLAQTFNSMQQGISEREQQLKHLAYHDAVTGLPNLRKAELEIDQFAVIDDAPFAVVVIELSALEDVRATLGDTFFDATLGGIAACLQEQLRDGTFVARIGPYSFMVLLRAEAVAQAARIAGRICDALRHGLDVDQVRVVLDGVAGVALAPEHGRSSADLLRRSLIAMRSAKQQEEPVARYTPGSDELFRRRLELSAALPEAIEDGQVTLCYQPKVNMLTRQVVGAEALARWTHPQFGVVSPAEFVPLAERSGAIRDLTRHALHAGVQQLADWQARGLQVDLAVNISAADILDAELAPRLLADLRRAGVAPSRLILEITETAVMRDRVSAARHMELLRVAGIRFSIDDFGTGHSSLLLLQALPVDELKIDQQFVTDVDSNVDSAKIVHSTVELARALELKVVAEGIESEAVWNVLAGFGCHLAQGYHISRPLTPEAFLEFVARSNTPTTQPDDTQQAELSLLYVCR